MRAENGVSMAKKEKDRLNDNNQSAEKESKQKKSKAPKIEEPEYVSEAIAKKVRNKERTQKTSRVLLILLLLCFIVMGIVWGSIQLLNYNSYFSFIVKLGDIAKGQGIAAYKDVATKTPVDDSTISSVRLAPLRDARLENIDFNVTSTEFEDASGHIKHADYNSYSFYIENNGTVDTQLILFLEMTQETQSVADAARIRIMVTDPSTGATVLDKCYAREDENGNPEKVVHDSTQYFGDNQELANRETSPFYDDQHGAGTTTIANETIDTVIQPGENIMFTIFVWFDGSDPECVDEILGGTFSLAATVEVCGDQNN